MKSYSEKLKDPRWQRKRLSIFERDEWKCRDCQSADGQLNVHHCGYVRNPWDAPDEILMTLCNQCHSDRQEKEDDARLALARLFSRLPNKTGADDSLLCLVQSMVSASGKNDATPIMDDLENIEYISDVRWYLYACENKSGRRMYEHVIGRKPKWRTR